MGQLVEERFVRECRNWADGDLPATSGAALGVAVKVFKLDSLDVQPLKCGLLVPSGNSRRLLFRTFRLGQNKPMGLVGEMREGEFLFLLGAVLFRYIPCALVSERHTKCQRLLALLYMSA